MKNAITNLFKWFKTLGSDYRIPPAAGRRGALAVPPSHENVNSLEIDWCFEETTMDVTWDHGRVHWYIDHIDLCRAFRNGVGYDFIKRELEVLKASGSCTHDEALQLRDFLRSWGHANEARF